MKLPFYQVDVFTSERFGGNPLAVFLEADDLDELTMQKIAREMNLSETTFVLRPASTESIANVRVFTPGRELPFAGHPTIGTAFVLDRLGKIPGNEFAFDMAVGTVPIRRDGDRFWMTPPPAEPIGGAFDRAAVANALGLPTSAVMNPPQLFGGRGVTFLCVLLDTQANVDWVMLDRNDLARACGDEAGAGNILVFSYMAGTAYARMFADLESNIGEDPATGSAVAPLCASLAQWRVVDQSRTSLTVEQGTQMGRQSHLYAQFAIEHTTVQHVTVGGSCVPVFESVLEL
jgi:trans-2,3-dihydro-3-hydroxyanthranilate isomerase